MQLQENKAKTGNEIETVSAQANTATINVKNPQSDRSVKARVLLDPGSHRTNVTEKSANRLELKRLEKEIISVVTFGSTKPKQI